MNGPSPIRVVGVGSAVGDDAVAWEVVRRLREHPDCPADAALYTAHGGQRILDVLDGRGTLVLIDAVMSGEIAGTIHRLEWPDPRIESLRPGSTHDLRPAEALRLAVALEIAPPRIIVFGIEVGTTVVASGLSPEMMAAVPQLVNQLVEMLAGQLTRID
jgi:hydrogenase maturation protease